MKNIFMPNRDIRPLAFLLSVLLSIVWFSKGQPINIDGITYLHLAKEFLTKGAAVFHTYN